MRLLHWCMLGVTVLLLMCEVAIGHLYKSLITMVDGFHTLFILMHMALPQPDTAAAASPRLSSLEPFALPPQPPLSSPSVTGTPLESPAKSPLADETQAASDHPAAPPGRAADSLATLDLNQLPSPSTPPDVPTCGLSFSRGRIQTVGVFLSSLILTSLCVSYLLEIIGYFLDPRPLQRPLLLLLVAAASLLHKTLAFGLNRSPPGRERAEGPPPPADEAGLRVKNEKTSVEEFVSRQEDERAAPSPADNRLRGVVLCNPETSSIPGWDSQTQQEPGVQSTAAAPDAQTAPRAAAERRGLLRRRPVCRLSPVSVLQGLFTSLMALITSLVMLLVAPRFPHASEACNPLVYLDPALSLLAVITLIASSLPQVYKYGLLLLQAAPPHICVSDVGRRIESVPGVQAMHDLHIWQLNESLAVASVHVHCFAGFPAHRCADVMSGVTKVLQSVGVRCCTVQPEFVPATGSRESGSAEGSPVIHREDPSPPHRLTCSLSCRTNCSGSMCCSPQETGSPAAPPDGETNDEPHTLVIENTFV